MDQNQELLYLSGIIAESDIYQEDKNDINHYMFFSNLHTIKEKVNQMLSMDKKKIDQLLSDGHDWASDHISTSKDDIEEVYNWISSSMEGHR